LQFCAWLILVVGGLVTLAFIHIVFGMLFLVLAQFLPRGQARLVQKWLRR
jgi:hypothetical protein